jgi:hypothetical protein
MGGPSGGTCNAPREPRLGAGSALQTRARPYTGTTVPLSEREQKILEEIEKNLYEEDPRFAHGVRRRTPKMDEVRRVKLGAVLFLCGFAMLIGFFLSGSLLVGVGAFGAMVGGIVMVAGAMREFTGARRIGSGEQRERISGVFRQWEERLRNRYKRR